MIHHIRNYQKRDEAAIENIVYRTGFNGEDLTGRNYFDDRRLFFLLFGYYYVHYEPQHCFVAVDTSQNTVVGYVFGTTDTVAQQERFQSKITWRLMLRAFLVTRWRYPGTYKTLMGMRGMGEDFERAGTDAGFLAEYPAHLHINVLPAYHGMGIGTRLMQRFEEHLIQQGVAGVHLQTSNYNRKAIPFYKKMGYLIIQEMKAPSHPLYPDFVGIKFAKKL